MCKRGPSDPPNAPRLPPWGVFLFVLPKQRRYLILLPQMQRSPGVAWASFGVVRFAQRSSCSSAKWGGTGAALINQ